MDKETSATREIKQGREPGSSDLARKVRMADEAGDCKGFGSEIGDRRTILAYRVLVTSGGRIWRFAESNSIQDTSAYFVVFLKKPPTGIRFCQGVSDCPIGGEGCQIDSGQTRSRSEMCQDFAGSQANKTETVLVEPEIEAPRFSPGG